MSHSRRLFLGLGILVLILIAVVVFRTSSSPEDPPSSIHGIEAILPGPPTTADPHASLDTNSLPLVAALHAPLMRVDPDGDLQPVIARSMTMSDDQMSCRVALNPEAGFWDGTPVSGEAVKTSFERFRSMKPVHGWVLDLLAGVEEFDAGTSKGIEGIEVTSSSEVVFHFARPDPRFPWYVSTPSVAVVKPAAEGAPKEAYDLQLVGCGPYKPDKVEAGNRIDLVPNHGFPFPTAGKLSFSIVDTVPGRLSLLKAEEADWVKLGGVELEQIAEKQTEGTFNLKAGFEGYHLELKPAEELLFIRLNWNSAALSEVPEPSRKTVIKKLGDSVRSPVADMYLGGTAAEATNSVLPRFGNDIGSATPEGGNPALTIELLVPNDADSRRVSAVVVEQAKNAGVTFKPVYLDLADLAGRMVSGKHEAVLVWVSQAINDPILGWLSFFNAKSPFSSIGQPMDWTGDEALKIRSEVELMQRQDLQQRFARRLNEEQAYWIPLVTRKSAILLRDGLTGDTMEWTGNPIFSDLRWGVSHE